MNSPAVFHLSEIRRQLEILGYRDVPEEKLLEFKADLDALVSSVDGDDGGSSQVTPRGGRLVRRKTARRLPGGGRAVVEESCHSSVLGDADLDRDDDVSGYGEGHDDFRSQQVPPHPPAPPSSAGGGSGGGAPRPRQLIRPTPRSAIEGLSFRRSDPVRRYHQYAALWAAQGPTPGETQHRALRWAVREHLAEAHVPAGAPPPPPPGRTPRGEPPPDRAAALRDEIRRELAGYGFK